jgi:hypothetical protein
MNRVSLVAASLTIAALLVVPAARQQQAVAGATAGEPAGEVDLSFRIESATVPRGGTAVHRLHVRNGETAFAGPVALTYVTPLYVNIDRAEPLPDGCAMHLEAPEPTVPEVVKCRITGQLQALQEIVLEMPLAVTPRARFEGRVLGLAMAAPAAESGALDANLSDNWEYAQLRLLPPAPETPPGNPTDLYLVHDVPALAANRPGALRFHIGNKGPSPALGGTHLTFVTPFYVNHHGQLPPGCTMRLTDADPLVPEIVTCALPPLAPGATRSVSIPVDLVDHAPHGQIGGLAQVAPTTADRGTDVETWQIDNFLPVTAVNITTR